MRSLTRGFVAVAFIAFSTGTLAAPVAVPNTFTAGTAAKAADVNANFQALVDAINANKVAAGTTIAFSGPTCPTGTLAADGTAVSRTTYAALFTAIGVSHGSGDGTATTGTTFNLPDYRGLFLRGVNGTATTDPDSATRTAMNTGGNVGNKVGSVQADDFKSHIHNGQVIQGNGTVGGTLAAGTNYSKTLPEASPATGGNETRPKNAYVNYCIYY